MKIAYNIFHTEEKDNLFRNSLYDSSTTLLDRMYSKLDTPTIFFENDSDAENFITQNDDFNPIDTFKRGEIGIWASNFVSWKNFLDSNFDALINLEDDSFVQSDFKSKLDLLLNELPPDWDIVSLYCHPTQNSRFSDDLSVSENLSKPFQTWSTLCYLISKNGAKKSLEFIKRGFHLPMDIYMLSCQNYLNVYNVKPNFGNSVALVNINSTIQNVNSLIQLKEEFYQNTSMWKDLQTSASKFNLIHFVYGEEDIGILSTNIQNELITNILIFCDSKIKDFLTKNCDTKKLIIILSEYLPNYQFVISNVNRHFSELENLNIILNQSLSPSLKLIKSLDINFLHKWHCLSIGNNQCFVFRGSIDYIVDCDIYYPGCDETFISRIRISGYITKLLPSINEDNRSLLTYRNILLIDGNKREFKDEFYSNRKINKKVALENLKDITTILKEMGIKHWIQDGTLLGYLREGDFISHDYDTDIGLTSDSMRPEVIFKLLDRGFMIPIIHGYLRDGFIITLKRNGVRTDLFFYYQRGEEFYHSAFVGPLGAKRKIDYIYKRFDVNKVEFLGHRFYAPEDPLYFILTKYGNTWQIPDTSWGFAFSSKNHRLTDVYINYEKAKQEFNQWLNL